MLGWGLTLWVKRWRARIRDEAYLIGERLHNFGERKPKVRSVMSEARRFDAAVADAEGSVQRRETVGLGDLGVNQDGGVIRDRDGNVL